MTARSEAPDRRAIIRSATPRGRAAVWPLAWGVLANVSAVGLLATSAWLIARAAEQPPILFLGFAIVGVRAFALGRAVFRYLERLSAHDGAFRSLAELRVGVYRRLVPVAPDGLRGVRSGDLLTTVVRDVDTLQDQPLRVRQPLVTGAIVVGLAVLAVALVSVVAAITLAVVVALTVTAALGLLSLIARDSERRIAPLRGQYAAAVLDYVTRWEELSAFDAADAARAQLAEIDRDLMRAERRQTLASGAVAAVFTLGAGIAVVATLVVAEPQLLAGALTGPQLALLVLVPLAIVELVAALPAARAARWRVQASAERLAAAIPAVVPDEIPTAPADPKSIPSGHVELRLRGVSARWPGASTSAIEGINVDVRAGERLLVTGASGAGKTTLAHVLVRFLAHAGTFTLNGVDVTDVHPDEVRRHIVLIEQSPHLFDESIRQNLLFADDTADDVRLTAVLDRVGLAEWMHARGGLDAPVGERGRLVSGGQAQRLALARGLLARAPVLVLDEPTANVDPERAEALLADLLGAAADADRAVIVISHTPVDDAFITARLAL